MKHKIVILSASLLFVSNTVSAAIQVNTFASANVVNSLAIADGLIAAAANPMGTATQNFVDNYDGSGGMGNFNNNIAFPGGFTNRFTLQATCQLTIPTAGDYTFGTNNDDGARLRINNSDVIVDDSNHGTRNFTGIVNLAAGIYPLELVFFENGGGASIELYAVAGNTTPLNTFNIAMRLVGDEANGGLACNVPETTGTIAITGSQPGSNITITVTDADLNTNAAAPDTVDVTVVNSTGETEVVTLTETGPATGIFIAILPTANTPAIGADNDGTLNTQVSNTITATYIDEVDGLGASQVPVAASITINEIQPVPTLSTWGLILMSSMLGLFGLLGNRKKLLK